MTERAVFSAFIASLCGVFLVMTPVIAGGMLVAVPFAILGATAFAIKQRADQKKQIIQNAYKFSNKHPLGFKCASEGHKFEKEAYENARVPKL
ncbi:hypothetical protein [Neptuniibacter sp. QD37_11]|uniref:hypothetical protein n=1 Tax=Neptuniibacter sp. QD37_11 TaxID=3398209 RepID=UPI0039F5078E